MQRCYLQSAVYVHCVSFFLLPKTLIYASILLLASFDCCCIFHSTISIICALKGSILFKLDQLKGRLNPFFKGQTSDKPVDRGAWAQRLALSE